MASPPPTSSKATASEVEEYLNSRLKSTSATTSFRAIPIIDLQPSFSASLAARKEVAKKIHDACATIGFFYITGHGLEKICEKTLKLADDFFTKVPQTSKESMHVKNSKYLYGYEPPAYTTINTLDDNGKETKEAFNWGYEAGLDPVEGDGKYVELDGSVPTGKSNQWPLESDLPGFYEGVSGYYSQVRWPANLGKTSLI